MPKNKKDMAAALKYDRRTMRAPALTAKGEGYVARRIVERAMEADVPIVEDAALVSALMSLELGEEVPAELYQVVARVLTWVYRLDKEHRDAEFPPGHGVRPEGSLRNGR